MGNIRYGRKRLKDIVKKGAAEEEAKQQQQDDDEQFDTVPKIKLVHEGKHVKELRATENLNNVNTKVIMAIITAHTKMRTKVIYCYQRSIDVLVKVWITARH